MLTEFLLSYIKLRNYGLRASLKNSDKSKTTLDNKYVQTSEHGTLVKKKIRMIRHWFHDHSFS